MLPMQPCNETEWLRLLFLLNDTHASLKSFLTGNPVFPALSLFSLKPTKKLLLCVNYFFIKIKLDKSTRNISETQKANSTS